MKSARDPRKQGRQLRLWQALALSLGLVAPTLAMSGNINFLRRAIEGLRREAGLQIKSAFEQELVYTGVDANPGTTYGYDSFRHQGVFGEALISAMRRAGVVPDSFLPEYAPRQYEVTVWGIRAADEAVIVREMARGVAFRLGKRVILSPVVDVSGVGNGTHIHFSLLDAEGRPAMRDPSGHLFVLCSRLLTEIP